MPIKPRFIKLHNKTAKKLTELKKEAERDGEYRVAKRIHAVLLNNQKKTSGEISCILDSSRSKVSEWLRNYELHGYESLLEGHRSGRPCDLSDKQLNILSDIIDSGPVAYGFSTGIWTSIMIRVVIHSEFNVVYHSGHVRKMLKNMGFSMQIPKRVLAKANEEERSHWRRYIYPSIKKKPLRPVPL